MRDVHLPQLIQSYIDVPLEHRDEIFKRTGKSASFHLGASLDKLQERVNTMLRDLAEHDIAAFTNNTRRSEEHTSELQSLMRISYAVFCLKTNTNKAKIHQSHY